MIPVFDVLQIIIVITIIGNSLVVVAVFSYRPLKKVQNYFLVSLAASDLCVAAFVMPLHVVKFIAGREIHFFHIALSQIKNLKIVLALF